MSDATNTTATENAAPDISTMSFETAVAELERIVDHLERLPHLCTHRTDLAAHRLHRWPAIGSRLWAIAHSDAAGRL